jgi:hypothetical protein
VNSLLARARPALPRLVGAVVCVALAAFYVHAASTHGRLVNTSKARGDQSGYLWDAQNVYANWHGRQPPALIGERNRMPLYAGYLALFYRPGLTDTAFFDVGKTANICLSLALLAMLGVLVRPHLPLHAAMNFVGIVAFGVFIYKAGYTQSEILFYFLLFVAFLQTWPLVDGASGWRAAWLAVTAGMASGLAHLTKAAMLPYVAIVLAFVIARALAACVTSQGAVRPGGTLRPLALPLLFAASFLIVVSPYILTSRRVFGQYFYNVNSTFYAWYDDWPRASVGTRLHNDSLGWPTMPAADLPGPARYWREHTLGQIGRRLAGGFSDIASTSHRTLGFLPYLVVCAAAGVWSAGAQGRGFLARLHRHLWWVSFLVVYGASYLLLTAFYHPISGTGTGRFFAAHLAPLFFVLMKLLSHDRSGDRGWHAGRRVFDADRVQSLVTILLAVDLVFRLWPRLMTTYGGF